MSLSPDSIVIITGRLKSTRLKNKLLLADTGEALISYLVGRLVAGGVSKDRIVLATSTLASDDPLVLKADRELGIQVYRGDPEDVLARYLECMEAFSAVDAYITYGDEPFVDIDLLHQSLLSVKQVPDRWVRNDNQLDGTFGYAFNIDVLRRLVQQKDCSPEVWIYMAEDLGFTSRSFEPRFPEYSKVRLTVDYPEDYRVFCLLLETLGPKAMMRCPLGEICRTYDQIGLFSINGECTALYQARIEEQGSYDTKDLR